MVTQALRLTCALACIVPAMATPIVAQIPYVAPEFYNTIRPDHGNTLPLCLIPGSATEDFDREIAVSIAQILLLEPLVVELDVDMDQLDERGIWPTIFTALSEECVGVLGVQIIRGETMPDWMTLSRPYLDAPYVLLTSHPATRSLADLPDGSRVGAPLYTPIDAELMGLIASGGSYAQLRRLPYDTPELMRMLFEAGDLDAAIVWQPHLTSDALSGEAFYARSVPVDPLSESTRELAILLRSEDQMMRTLIDDAILALPEPYIF